MVLAGRTWSRTRTRTQPIRAVYGKSTRTPHTRVGNTTGRVSFLTRAKSCYSVRNPKSDSPRHVAHHVHTTINPTRISVERPVTDETDATNTNVCVCAHCSRPYYDTFALCRTRARDKQDPIEAAKRIKRVWDLRTVRTAPA